MTEALSGPSGESGQAAWGEVPSGTAAADLGILVYVDNSPGMLAEFGWLYKSMILCGLFARARLIVACHPDAIALLPQDDRILVVPSVPYSARNAEWAGYGYINSVVNLCEPAVADLCRRFRYLLKTDCDTFVTPALALFQPTTICFGFGGYAYEESVRLKLSECSARWGFPHSGLHNVGASLLAPTEMALAFLSMHADYCHRLMAEEFRDFTGAWPGWFKGVLTMYAGELALRASYPQRNVIGLLDHFPYQDRPLGSDVLHVHAWQTDQYWSKQDYRLGKYDHMALDAIDRSNLAGYCHWLAAADVETVARAAEA